MSDITNSAGTLASPHHRSNSPTKRTVESRSSKGYLARAPWCL